MAGIDSIVPRDMDPLDYIVRVRENTVKKDRRYLTMAILTMFSAYLPEPVNLDVQAPSSEGKTYVVVEASKLFPKEDVWAYVGATPKSFFYDKAVLVDKDTYEPVEDKLNQLYELLRKTQDKEEKQVIKEQIREIQENSVPMVDLENKIIIFLDTPDINTLNAIKTILSHDDYYTWYKFTDKDKKGRIKTRQILLKGWPAVIIIRVEAEKRQADYSQISSRFLLVSPNMSKEKYREAIKLIALRMGKPAIVVNKILKVEEVEKAKLLVNAIKQRLIELRDKARKTGNYKTSIFFIPFSEKLAEQFPHITGRNMRDFTKFMLLLQLIAAVNVFKRPILRIGDTEYIIVVKRDFEKAYELMLTEEEKISIFTGVPKHVSDWFRKVLVPLSKERGTLYISDLVDETPKRIEKFLSSNTIRTVYLKPLENAGFITFDVDPEDKRRKIIKLLREDVSLDGKTPDSVIFENSRILELDYLKRELSELSEKYVKKDITIFDFDGSVLTIEELFEKYYGGISQNQYFSGNTDKSLLSNNFSRMRENEKFTESGVIINEKKIDNSLSNKGEKTPRNDNETNSHLEALILRIVKERQPLEVKKLLSVSFVDYSKDDVVKALKHLIKTGKLREENDLLWVSGL